MAKRKSVKKKAAKKATAKKVTKKKKNSQEEKGGKARLHSSAFEFLGRFLPQDYAEGQGA